MMALHPTLNPSNSTTDPDYLNALPALVAIALWLISYLAPLIVAYGFRLRHSAKPQKLPEASHQEQSPLLQNLSLDKTGRLNGALAVWEAENRIIDAQVQREGGLGVIEYLHGSTSTLLHPKQQDYPNRHPTRQQLFTAFASAWKDWLTAMGSFALLGVSSLQYHYHCQSLPSQSNSLNWFFPAVLLWSMASILSLVKVALLVRSNIRSSEYPGDVYISIESRLIPTYLLFLPFNFYGVWNAALVHLDRSPSISMPHRDVILEELKFILLALITLIELCSPRPTRLLPPRGTSASSKSAVTHQIDCEPPPLEPRSSLLSLAYFTHSDKYLFYHAFATTANKASIPSLRADDKTAAVMFRWKHDEASYASLGIQPSLLRSLIWHFRGEIGSQQIFSWFNAVGALLPPFFLQRILGFIEAKAAGRIDSPNHVAVLYAVGMLATQVFLAYTQSAALFIGRRLSVRMRSLFISLIFTKSLRRADTRSSPSENPDASLSTQQKSSRTAPASGGKVDNEEEGRASVGKIVNLVSNDTMSLSEIGAYLSFLWPESVVQLVLAAVYLYLLLGYSALAGMACLVIGLPIQSFLTDLWAQLQKELLMASDRRLALTGELINNIKVVKFFAWETKFTEKMSELREAELYVLFKRIVVGLLQTAVSCSVPIAVSIATFWVHTKIRNEPLTAEQAFTALALFNVLRFPLGVMAGMIAGLLQSYVALRRIEEFLSEPETEKYSTLSCPKLEEGDPIVGFRNASFTYGGSGGGPGSDHDDETQCGARFVLKSLNFGFPVGELSLIIGRVGSGKTTLLLSLLGETNKLSGSAFLPSPVARESGLDPALKLTDTTAYAPQQPWLLSDTIRNNILFGSLMNLSRYQDVLKACALVPDLLTFTDGDLTEIGDKGTVLSGGQKARISLARALYSPAKVLRLDDILSAVDSHTGQHLFDNVLTGNLVKERTCILVTHAVDLCLPGAGFVVSLDQGEVTYAGKPSLSKTASLIFDQEDAETAKPGVSSHQDQTIEELAESNTTAPSAVATKTTQKLIEDEQQAIGAVSSTVYKLYFKALGGVYPLIVTLILYTCAEVGNTASNWILKEWAGSSEQREPGIQSRWNFIYNPTVTITTISRQVPELLHWHRAKELLSTQDTRSHVDKYLLWYTLASLITLLLQLSRHFYFTMRGVRAARSIYDRLIRTVLNARVRFFDTVPMGRVLNRFSKDVQTMDRDLSDNLIYLTSDIIAAIAILCIVVVVLPFGFLVVSIGASLFYAMIGYIYLSSTREIKRSESTARSPVISICTECLQGATSIRAYGDIGRWTELAFKYIDQYNRSYFMLWVCNRWLSSRIDVTAAFFTFAVTVWMIQHDVSAALAGFALSFVISFNVKTLWVVRWWSINEINMNSLERIHEYLDIEQEPESGIPPPAAWPSRSGSIEVENLSARYAPNLPLVLKNVSFRVEPGEKIGICGRTGSGKSSLALSFFRFIEAVEGRILIDGQDISKLDLVSLRSRLTIIPQESVLFTATIKWNLDPFGEHEESRIWDALRRVGMAAPLGVMVHGTGNSSTSGPDERGIEWITSLEMNVEDGGRNFSTGQRQLLAIARAILKLQSSSILILDESTASLDAESDEKIQKTIRTEMEGSTILCIAHRLKTIIDYDKVLVLGNGQVLEFGKPKELIVQEDSLFRKLCDRSGHLNDLKEMAGV